jgi:phage-related protein
MTVVDVTFQSNDLQTTVRVSSVVMHEDIPDKRVRTQKLARRDGQIITGVEYTGKTITISGTMAQTTQALLDADIDLMKSQTLTQEGTLAISFSGGTRNYVATCTAFDIVSRSVTMAKYKIEFFCADPFGRATTPTNHSSNGITATPKAETVVNAGTYEVWPTYTMQFSAASSVTGIGIANTTTGEAITVTTAVTATDLIVVNAETMVVTKNGTAVDYSGTFPHLAVGNNTFAFTAPGTSRTYDLDVDFTARYL